VAADRRLRQAERLRRAAEVPQLGDDEERAQVTQLEIDSGSASHMSAGVLDERGIAA
jgi:hypothetical protein